MVRVLVTGATGCVGANVVEALLERGYEVRALHRASSDLAALTGLTPELVVGDVLDPASLQAAVAGCDWVIHTAAISQYWRNAPHKLYAVNIVGTRNVLDAALAAGVSRVVFTSSVAVLGVPVEAGQRRNETDSFNWHPKRFHYGHTKLLAEAEVARVRARGLDVVCVNPATVIGRRDLNFVGGAILRAVKQGWTLIAPSGGMGIVASEAVGLGHVLAAESGRSGERYVLSSENVTHEDLLRMAATTVGGRAPVARLPRSVGRFIVLLGRLVEGFAGDYLPLTYSQVLMQLDLSSREMYFDGTKAERELGLPHIGIRAAIEDAWTWYRDQGML